MQPIRRIRVLGRILARWGAAGRATVWGRLWIAVLLFALVWLQRRTGGMLLVPPFAATMTILLYLPDVPIAQPFAVVAGSTAGAAIGTLLCALLGAGAETAAVAALTALIVLPMLRAFHPPGVALALYPALVHPGTWFAVQVVLPFTLAAVISASVWSRIVGGWPRYPRAL
jgi:CBS-domain-containing membrane protein